MAKPAVRIFRTYWRLYGGFSALFGSPYLYVGLALTGLLAPFWLEVDEKGGRLWAQTAIDTVPSMLGFSMGGMAIMLAFSNASIFGAITQKGSPTSYFVTVVANFYHFILVQTLAILSALACMAYPNDFTSAVGFFVFSYAILVGIATAGQLLGTAQIFNASASLPVSKEPQPDSDEQ
ncbi:hypothetical protein [Rhizobium leguminosarum]|uniref:hypothetical protein n=1 Tax=Rhizobium leguminosarum TaxID=384 RepID=UPI001FDF408C|nr:hypothetical protein [Rhizobium leguminosarum]